MCFSDFELHDNGITHPEDLVYPVIDIVYGVPDELSDFVFARLLGLPLFPWNTKKHYVVTSSSVVQSVKLMGLQVQLLTQLSIAFLERLAFLLQNFNGGPLLLDQFFKCTMSVLGQLVESQEAICHVGNVVRQLFLQSVY